MHDIDIYDNSLAVLTRKEEKIYIRFIISFTIGLLVLGVLLFIKYPRIYYFEGIASDNDIVLILKKDELKYLKGDTLVIDDKEINYNIKSIVELENLDIKYYSVRIYTNEEYIDNNVIDFKIQDGKTTILKSVIQKLWKGFRI